MRKRSIRAVAIVTVAGLVVPSAVVACAGPPPEVAPVWIPPASPAASPPRRPGAPFDEGIGLGTVDAGPDARHVEADAGSILRVNGRLAPEIIQRVVRASFDPFRKCYEAGLARDRDLQGKVTTKFVIDRTGAVKIALSDPTPDAIPDPEVVACVVDAFRRLRFPAPDGGIVTVVYPIIFKPGV